MSVNSVADKKRYPEGAQRQVTDLQTKNELLRAVEWFTTVYRVMDMPHHHLRQKVSKEYSVVKSVLCSTRRGLLLQTRPFFGGAFGVRSRQN